MNKRLLLISLVLSLIATLNLGLLIGVARADPDTLYVDDDYDSSTPGWGVDHFNTIQEAADAAADGDTIHVYAGTYYESINVTQKDNLTFTAEKGGKPVKSVVIDADGHDGFELRSCSGLTISGFQITDANVGIDAYLVNCSSFKNNHIEDCWQLGAYITGSYTEIVGNYFKNTSGIHCSPSGEREMIGTVLSKNTILDTEVYGIFLYNVVNCSITHNVISNATIGINMLYYGGNCSGNVIMHNDISNVIGGIKLEPHVYPNLPPPMEDNIIGHNYIHNVTSFPGYGYGIDVQYWGGGVVENTEILHNTIEDADIGIRNKGNSGQVHHNDAINCATDYIDLGTANIDFKNSWNP